MPSPDAGMSFNAKDDTVIIPGTPAQTGVHPGVEIDVADAPGATTSYATTS